MQYRVDGLHDHVGDDDRGVFRFLHVVDADHHRHPGDPARRPA